MHKFSSKVFERNKKWACCKIEDLSFSTWQARNNWEAVIFGIENLFTAIWGDNRDKVPPLRRLTAIRNLSIDSV